MMIEPWFPKSYKIINNLTLKQIEYSDDLWQIYSASSNQIVFIAKEEIYNFWINLGYQLLDFSKIEYMGDYYFVFSCDNEYLLEPISKGTDFLTYTDAISFASAIAKTREHAIKCSLENGIFIEKLSILLPNENANSSYDDKKLLGTWLSGGISVSVENNLRMKQLLNGINKEEFKKILKTAKLDNDNSNKEVCKEEITAESLTNNKIQDVSKNNNFCLPGRSELETFFKEHVIDIIENPEDYKRMGIDFPAAFILQGPPGCGKTYAVEQLIKYLDWPSYYIESGTIGSPYIHDTSKKISEVFDTAIENAPSVIVIDEMESFLAERESSSGHHLEEVGEFLRRIPDARSKNVLVIAMTNMIGSIDPAISRKGRFDHIIEVGMPSATEIKMVIDSYLFKIPHNKDIDTTYISEKLVGHSMADVNFVLREVARVTAKNHDKMIKFETFEELLLNLDRNKKLKNKLGFKI